MTALHSHISFASSDTSFRPLFQQSPPSISSDKDDEAFVAISSIQQQQKQQQSTRQDERHNVYALVDAHSRPSNISIKWRPPEGQGEHLCDLDYGLGAEGIQGYQALKKIQIANNNNNKIRLLCIVYTHSGRHATRLEAISETWGRHCHGFLAASNQTDRTLGAFNVKHDGPEVYSNMWQKVRAIWKYVHEHYIEEFDVFYICGDDTLVIPENIIHQAATYELTHKPLYMGAAMGRTTTSVYCGGGAGYVLNRLALEYLVVKKESCRRDDIASDEDRIVAECLSDYVTCTHDTTRSDDETTFHILYPKFHAMWQKDIPVGWHPHDLLVHHNLTSPSKEGLASISKYSVSFHLLPQSKMKPRQEIDVIPPTIWEDGGMRRMYAILYDLCAAFDTKEYHPDVYNVTRQGSPKLWHDRNDNLLINRMYRNVVKLLLPEYQWIDISHQTVTTFGELDLMVCSTHCAELVQERRALSREARAIPLLWISQGAASNWTNGLPPKDVVELGPTQQLATAAFFYRLTEFQVLFCNTQRPQHINALLKENHRPVVALEQPLEATRPKMIVVSDPFQEENECPLELLLGNNGYLPSKQLKDVVDIHYYNDAEASCTFVPEGIARTNVSFSKTKHRVYEQIEFLRHYPFCLVSSDGALLMAFYAGCLPIYVVRATSDHGILTDIVNPASFVRVPYYNNETTQWRTTMQKLLVATTRSAVFGHPILQPTALGEMLSLVDWIGAGVAKKNIRSVLGIGHIEFVK